MIAKVDGKEIEFYTSAKDIPARQLMLFQLHLAQHNGMGSTFEEIDARFQRLDEFLSAGMLDEAINERKNMRYSYYMMMDKLNTATLPAACAIKSIDGVRVSIRTDEDIERYARLLQGEENGEVTGDGMSTNGLEEVADRLRKK